MHTSEVPSVPVCASLDQCLQCITCMRASARRQLRLQGDVRIRPMPDLVATRGRETIDVRTQFSLFALSLVLSARGRATPYAAPTGHMVLGSQARVSAGIRSRSNRNALNSECMCWLPAARLEHEATQPGLCVPPAADGRPSAAGAVSSVPLHAIDLSTAAAQRSLRRVASDAPGCAHLWACIMGHGP